MADLRIQYSEEMVGVGHPVKSDTLNRLSLVGHNNDGTHKAWADVMEYGALGDDSTDDTAAIQAAVDTGKDVFIPRGTFKVTSVITLTTASQTIWGLGERSYIKGTGANQNVFTASGVDGIKVYNVKIEAPSTKSGMSDGCGIYFINCDRVNILENLFTGGRSAGVQLKDCNYGSVCGNKFISSVVVPATDDHTQAGYDIYLTYSSSHNRVIGNVCISGIGVGIGVQTITESDTADFNTIVGNIVRDQPQYGIMLYRLNVADTLYNNVIANNTVANISGDVEHSTAGFVYGAGIYVQGAEYTAVNGNTIYNTNTNDNIVFQLAPGAIGVTNCRNVTITGNVIRDPEWYGICCQDVGELGMADGKATITGNVIENSTKKDGILLQDFPRATVTGNTVNSCAGHGIHVLDGTAAISHSYVINNNICENNTSCGINVVNCVSANIEGNHCNSNGTHGIHVDYGVYVIEGNTCRANTTRGIGTTVNTTDGTCAHNLLDGNNPNYTGNGNMKGLDTNIMINPGVTGNENGTFTRVRTFTSTDATPSVKNGKVFKTANAGATTITTFDDGVVGQEVTVIFNDTNTTIDFTGTNLKGNVGADFVGAVGDVMTGFFDGTDWFFQVQDNTL
jgi:hypothetical protein